MRTDEILVLIAGLLGIGFVYWFFLGKKSSNARATEGQGIITVIVDGGYTPEVISIPKGKTTKLNFIRRDPTDCLEEVVLGDFKIRKHLPLNQKVTVEINPKEAGEYGYACGMNMYHGKIIVK